MEGATGDTHHGTSLDPTAPGATVRDRETALLQAVAEGCWQRVIVLVQHGVSPSQRDTTLLQAAGSQQWSCAMDILHLGVSPEARDAIFLQAAEREQWSCVSDVLHLGVSRPVRDDVFLRAVRERRWDCAGKLFDLGVSAEKRDFVFSDVVGSGDARLTSQLITAGVSPALQEPVLRGAVEQGRVTFLVELLRLTDAPSVIAAVLETAVSLRDWTLVSEAVKLEGEVRLSQDQLDAACRAAVTGGQWDPALLLLERGARPTQETVDAALRADSHVLQRWLGVYPAEATPSGVKKMLIAGAMGLDSTDTLQGLLRRFRLSDEETAEAFESVVSCRNKEALKALLRCRHGNGQLLKRWCVSKSDYHDNPDFQTFNPSSDLCWISNALMWENKRDIVLGLDIGLAICNLSDVEATFHGADASWKVICMFLRKICVLYDWMFENIAMDLAKRGPRYRRALFLLTVRLGHHSTAVCLYGEGVSLRDVKYALGVAFSTPSQELPDGEVCWSKEQRLKDFFVAFNSNLEGEKGLKLLRTLVKESLDSFVERCEEEAEFLTWFKVYCEHEETDTGFGFSVFRRAYKAAVHWDRVECFVDCLTHVLLCNKNEKIRVARDIYFFPSGSFAFNEYVSVDDTRDVIVSIDFALKMQKFSFASQTVLVTGNPELGSTALKRVFLKGAWPVFDLLLKSRDPVVIARMCKYGPEFLHCLWETVVKAAETGTVKVGAVRVLDKWLVFMCPSWKSRERVSYRFTRELESDLRLGSRSDTVLRLAEFSHRNGYRSLALFLAAGVGEDGRELMQRVLASQRRAVASNVVFELACFAVENLKDFTVAAVLIKHLPMIVLSSTHCYMGHATQELRPKDVDGREALTAALLRESVPQWFLLRQLIDKNFVEAEATLVLCAHSQECVDVLVEHAAKGSRWDLVAKYMSHACRPDLLQLTLKTALVSREYIDASFVQRLVNLAGTAYDSELPTRPESRPESYLFDSCLDLPHHPQTALVLARCLVSLGASAQHRKVMRDKNCPLKRACYCQELPLVKLFHRSGASSNQNLFTLAADIHDSNFFWYPRDPVGRPGHVDPKEAIQSYLSSAASCPLSLQDLCRHAVSSSLGGRPGYMQRVQALPVPEAVREFILFSDLVQEESSV